MVLNPCDEPCYDRILVILLFPLELEYSFSDSGIALFWGFLGERFHSQSPFKVSVLE